jgi:uncharacterized protein YqhQ
MFAICTNRRNVPKVERLPRDIGNKMTAIRLIRWIFLLSAFIACVSWSYIAINNVLKYSTSEQQRIEEYEPKPHAASEHVKQTDILQKQWGRQSLFAVTCSFFFMLAVMMNWVLDGRPRINRVVK